LDDYVRLTQAHLKNTDSDLQVKYEAFKAYSKLLRLMSDSAFHEQNQWSETWQTAWGLVLNSKDYTE